MHWKVRSKSENYLTRFHRRSRSRWRCLPWHFGRKKWWTPWSVREESSDLRWWSAHRHRWSRSEVEAQRWMEVQPIFWTKNFQCRIKNIRMQTARRKQSTSKFTIANWKLETISFPKILRFSIEIWTVSCKYFFSFNFHFHVILCLELIKFSSSIKYNAAYHSWRVQMNSYEGTYEKI